MIVVTKIEEISSLITSLKSSKNTIGLVPTMGALHKGHISLIEKSVEENDYSVTTIFINPTQFDKKEDLENYPSTIDEDLKLLKNTGCDLVFLPEAAEMYKQNINSEVFYFEGLEDEMEGKHRRNHFDGVGTIVKKFFEIIQPTKAYFGEKDFQQLQIIKKMTSQECLPIEVIGCPIFRENDGLAMSSRNTRLTRAQREQAPFIFKSLETAATLFKSKSILNINSWIKNEFDKHPFFTLEYFEIANEENLRAINKKENAKKYRAFIAVYAGTIRLIDNISLQ
jgi:pantoate--beta-alanine ligase